MTTKLIFVEEIDFNSSPVVRSSVINNDAVEAYAESYTQKRDMPPIVVFFDAEAKKFYIADGRHRCEAIKKINRRAIQAVVHEGTYEDAFKFALSSNSTHGLPRTREDKRLCVTKALKQWPEVSNSRIAELTCVDDHTVARIREELEKAKTIPTMETRKTSDGRTIPATTKRLRTKKEADEDYDDDDDDEEEEEKPRVKTAEVSKDALGKTIPVGILKFWMRTGEALEHVHTVENLIGQLRQYQRDEDAMYGEVNFTGLMGDLERAHATLQTAVPYIVCPSCQGHPETQKNGCRMCIGRGLISKFRYQTVVPAETKKIVEKKGNA